MWRGVYRIHLESQEFLKFGPIWRILDDSQLDVLPEGLPELEVWVLSFVNFVPAFLCVILIFVFVLFRRRQLSQHLKGLAHQFLAHNFEHLVLLESFAGHVEREVVGIDNSTEKAAQCMGGQG